MWVEEDEDKTLNKSYYDWNSLRKFYERNVSNSTEIVTSSNNIP